MKKGCLPLLLSGLCLLVVLLWRMVGAPVSAVEWSGLGTAMEQARILLPSRAARVLSLWPLGARTINGNGAATPLSALRGSQAEGGLTLSVYHAESGQLRTMTLEEYVMGVVAAEMPASYHLEALKAQAVAARTRAVSQSGAAQGCGCSLYEGADICTDSTHCQAFADEEECRAKWGEEYSAYHARVEQAVWETTGEIITYDGMPITVLYHAISGGMTEDAQTVFSQSLPYLVSVESTGEEDARGYLQDTTFTLEEAAAKLKESFPEMNVTVDQLRQNFQIVDHTSTGRVKTVHLGDHELSAQDLRAALGLRSTWFTISMDTQTVTFHQRGYGHGVGMSQAGANSMAAQNKNYKEIVTYYYRGVEIQAFTE